jgi:hypothetical protein
VYHYELRKFPHTVCRYNQSEAQVRAVLVPWVAERWFEEGEQKWNSNEATLTVLEGPELSMPDLAMGRGWRNAQRRSEDVTERVLAAVSEQSPATGATAASTPPGGPPPADARSGAAAGEGSPAEGVAATVSDAGATSASQLLADSLGLELLGLLDGGPLALARAWSLAAERLGGVSAAESLALGELAVRSLLARGLVVLRESASPGADGDRPGAATAWQVVTDDRVGPALRAIDSWAGGEGAALQIARKS